VRSFGSAFLFPPIHTASAEEISGLAEKILNLFSLLQFCDPWLRKVFLLALTELTENSKTLKRLV
jgi:hypothetical protein